MKCEGYGRIQVECANTLSDDDSKTCNEGEDLCNESEAPINLFAAKQCSSDSTISAYGPPIDPSTYESPTSMIALSVSDVATIDATTDLESNNDKEIFDEEMTHSYKIMY